MNTQHPEAGQLKIGDTVYLKDDFIYSSEFSWEKYFQKGDKFWLSEKDENVHYFRNDEGQYRIDPSRFTTTPPSAPHEREAQGDLEYDANWDGNPITDLSNALKAAQKRIAELEEEVTQWKQKFTDTSKMTELIGYKLSDAQSTLTRIQSADLEKLWEENSEYEHAIQCWMMTKDQFLTAQKLLIHPKK